jgi:hypothetical protein
MKIKFDNYVNTKFKQTNLLFDKDAGILYNKNASNKLKELPNQNRNLIKLKKILENHPDNDDYQKIVYLTEIKEIQKNLNKTKRNKIKQNKQTKTQKIFGYF